MEKNLSEGQKIIEESFNYYLEKMEELHREGFEDEAGVDIDNWAAIKAMIHGYIDGEELDNEGLLFYFGDHERVEVVVSFYNIAKYLIKSGATLEI